VVEAVESFSLRWFAIPPGEEPRVPVEEAGGTEPQGRGELREAVAPADEPGGQKTRLALEALVEALRQKPSGLRGNLKTLAVDQHQDENEEGEEEARSAFSREHEGQ
jgi:hypothetical protein